MSLKKVNHRNIIKFANSLYREDKDGYIYYKPLCNGALLKTIKGETVGCILAELYEEFSGKPIFLIKNHYTKHPNIEEPEITRFLAYNAQIKKKLAATSRTQESWARICLSYEFMEIQEINDSIVGDNQKAMIKRAKILKQELISLADEFLY